MATHLPPYATEWLDELIDEATMDAYGEGEQRIGLFTMIEEHLALPFETQVLGVTVQVERVDMTEADDVVAICRREGERQTIPLAGLPLPEPPPDGAEWIAAYRRWLRRSGGEE